MKTRDNSTAWGLYLLVVVGAAAGLGVIAFGGTPWIGGVITGGALLVGSAVRLILSEHRAGALAIRTKKTDVVVFAVLGLALVGGSLSLLLRLHNT
ncbi:hypothetical protein GCM10023194_02320 [Planotetraspora phitsanulokensis]|uniref:DUF3017 domain-containing protein n=1 Tax=Planotetraspora phitsanulokensis TaxID=575192 RepID=A0A8J3XG75_9ACTN|nr:DUF3017 domain-containing protein [Planotetraspora phitsanulokensis]GII40492.1 hypothetical protein Pph01_54950 [Planotetraspora phitsanulokensis]